MFSFWTNVANFYNFDHLKISQAMNILDRNEPLLDLPKIVGGEVCRENTNCRLLSKYLVIIQKNQCFIKSRFLI